MRPTTSVTIVPIRCDEVAPSTRTGPAGRSSGRENPGPHGIVDVMVDVRDDVGDARDLALERC